MQKIKNITASLVVILAFSLQLSAQTADFKTKFEDADYYFLFEEYSKAIKIYKDLYEADKSNANINYLLGLCYIQSIKDKEKIKAIPYLEYAVKNINPKYKEGKYKESKAPIYSLFYLAFAYRLNNEFEKAIAAYRSYITYLKPKDREEMQNALKEIESCVYAQKIIQVPVNLETVKGNNFAEKTKESGVKLDSNLVGGADNAFVKATSAETFPIVSYDESFMIFSMGVNNAFPQEVQSLNFDFDQYKTDDIYYAVKKANGEWETPVNIMKQIKAKSQVAPVCLSHDGKTLYLVQDDNDNGNIYSSKFENGSWQPMVAVKGDINSRQWESHASLSPDDKTMYFTSARKGGFGGLDIYKSKLKETGEWGKAENLGPVINTSSDEETPFLLPDGKTLFFSSMGHKSIGGFDIFSSTMGENGKWEPPLNAGYSINTVNNDFAYINKIDKQLVYTPLNRTELRSNYSGEEDQNNSYKLTVNNEHPTTPVFEVKGTVVFKPGNISYPENFELSVLDSSKEVKLSGLLKNDLNGEYSFKASSGVYYLKYSTPGYKDFTQRILLPEIYTPSTILVNVELVPSNAGDNIASKSDVIFDYEKNFPDREKNRNVNILAYKNVRDSLKLIAENKIKTDEKNTNTDSQLIAEKKENDSKHSENKNLTQDNKNSKTDSKNNDDKNKKNNTDVLAENKSEKNIQNSKDQITNTNNSYAAGTTVVSDVLFDFDCIKPKDFKTNLDKLAAYLSTNKNCKISVEGHSDDQGEDFYKQIVSDMRADFIRKYLVENGAIKGNINTKGYGSTKLIASESTPSTRKYNRRAEFKIIEGCPSLQIKQITVPSSINNTYENSVSQGDQNAVVISNLLFNFDFLNPNDDSNLDKLADYLKQNPTCVIEIVGHSDAQGDDSYKKFVSQVRASNIRKILLQKGVKSSCLQARGEGDSKQISINNTPETRKYNRRVEFNVLKQGNQKLVIDPIKVPAAYQIK